MPFKKFRSRLSSSISQESAVSQSTDDESWGRQSFQLHPPVVPRVRGVRELGQVGDPQYNRECGGSVRIGDRTLWVWRDTHHVQSGRIQSKSMLSSTASWSDYRNEPLHGGSRRSGERPPTGLVLRTYGATNTEKAYFRIIHDGCEPQAGVHKDGSRRAMWPDTPPLVISSSASGRVIAYAWVQKRHIGSDMSVVTRYPSTTLYRISYIPSKDKEALPHASVVDGGFWNENEIPYGTYGSVTRDGIAYLYAQISPDVTAVARVLVDLVERKSCYEYCVAGEWTKTRPSITDSNINILNANAGGRGTYFWSEAWMSFVWVGASSTADGNCYITTASLPNGPWVRPFRLFASSNSSRSIQAHPSLLKEGEEAYGMYVSYTKCNYISANLLQYSTHLVYVDWDDESSSE